MAGEKTGVGLLLPHHSCFQTIKKQNKTKNNKTAASLAGWCLILQLHQCWRETYCEYQQLHCDSSSCAAEQCRRRIQNTDPKKENESLLHSLTKKTFYPLHYYYYILECSEQQTCSIILLSIQYYY